ncbi:DegT/DnrJ/EryC1/StrS family aminotransferase [[Clostridium] fimetarium]
MNIPFSPPDITEEEINAVSEVLRSGWLTTGPKTKSLENEIAIYCHTSKAVCLNSATACAEMALRLFDIGEGDEVIVPAYTYTASASVVCHVGAKLVLVDTAPGSYHIDYDALEIAITEKTKAIIPVDIAGVMADYNRILEIVESKKHLFKASSKMQAALGRILVLSDSAHGFGASRLKKMSGEVADFTSFSFHAVKNFTTGEGGALVWKDIVGVDNEEIYKKLMLLTLHGQSKDALAKTQLGSWEYDIVAPYYKCNMTDIMAAIGLVQMKRYEGLLKRRKVIIEAYTRGLEGENIEVIQHFSNLTGTSTILCNSGDNGTNDCFISSGHLYLVRLIGKDSTYRNGLITKMAENGVATNVHYKPLPMHTAYKNLGFDINDYPNAYAMFENEITLPLNTCLTDEQVQYIIDVFKECNR